MNLASQGTVIFFIHNIGSIPLPDHRAKKFRAS